MDEKSIGAKCDFPKECSKMQHKLMEKHRSSTASGSARS